MNDSPGQIPLWPDVITSDVAPTRLRRVRPHAGLAPISASLGTYVQLVLASGSASRVAVLKSLGFVFTIDPANVDESIEAGCSPRSAVRELSSRKAAVVASRHRDGLVLAADTLISLDGHPIGKPRTLEQAQEILMSLGGRTHEVVSGITLVEVRSGEHVTVDATTTVTFRPLTRETVRRYATTGEPLGKAGAYALQGTGALLVSTIDGEYTNVLGFPVNTFQSALAHLGYEAI